MTEDRNRTSVLRQLAALQKMTLTELQDKWRDLYGTEPPNFSRMFIQKRLAYRIQELFYGGLSGKTKDQLSELAKDDPVASLLQKNTTGKQPNPTGKLCPGTRLLREWNDNKYEVNVKDNGFEFNGKMYRSLSAVATAITGARWSGNLFFGLRKRKR